MADQQDNHSLDSLFRSSFDGLNETPAPNGWDTPSDRVWQQVHSQIQTPASGFSVGKGILVATIILAIVLALGYFGAFGVATPSAPANDQHPAVTPIEAQHTPSVESPNAATPQPVAADEPQVTKSKPVNPAKNPNVKEPIDLNSTKPVNSTPTAPPNSTEKHKQKAQQ